MVGNNKAVVGEDAAKREEGWNEGEVGVGRSLQTYTRKRCGVRSGVESLGLTVGLRGELRQVGVLPSRPKTAQGENSGYRWAGQASRWPKTLWMLL